MWQAILGGLLAIAPSLIGRFAIGLGISAITFTGVNSLLVFLKTMAVSNFQLLGVTIVGYMATMKLGTCVSMLISAYVVRLTLSGLSAGGSITKWIKG